MLLMIIIDGRVDTLTLATIKCYILSVQLFMYLFIIYLGLEFRLVFYVILLYFVLCFLDIYSDLKHESKFTKMVLKSF